MPWRRKGCTAASFGTWTCQMLAVVVVEMLWEVLLM
jgi:hypothetical protein